MIALAFHTALPRFAAFAALIGLSSCSTVVEGRSQTIAVDSFPRGAQCTLKEADEIVGRVTTPGNAEVRKSKNDVMVLCYKEGYESASARDRSDYALASLGNMVMGQYSFLGNAVDSLSGASNKYDSAVFVTLARAETPAAFPAPPGLPPVVHLSERTATAMSMQVPLPVPVGPALHTFVLPGPILPGPVSPAPVLKASALGRPPSNDQTFIKEARAIAAPVESVQVHALAPASAKSAVVKAASAKNAVSSVVPPPFAVATIPVSASPAIKASAQMAKATAEAYTRAEPQPFAYAQAEAETPRRPPFDIAQ